MSDSEQSSPEPQVTAGEIGADVADQMRQLSQSQISPPPAPPLFDPGAAYGIVPPQGFPSLSGDIGDISSPDDQIRVPSIGRSAKTLEDLYESYPRIGDGSHFIRIERKKPEIWDNVRISGFLDDLGEQISMQEFAERYGGGEYLVTVRGPVKNSLDSDGRVKTRSLEAVTLKFPGLPKRAAQMTAGDDMQRGLGMGMQPMNQLVVDQFRGQQEEKRRLEQRLEEIQRQSYAANTRGMDPAIMQALTSASEKRADEAKSAQAETISELRRQTARKDELLEQKDTEVQKLRQQVLDIQREATARIHEEESKQVRELKERHERDLAQVKDDHARSIERITEEHRRSMKEMADRQADDRNKTERDYSQERERSREDVARREATLKGDYDRQIQLMTQNYESRLTEAHRQNEREMASIKDQRDREISSMREIMESRAKTAESMASTRVSLLEAEIARLRTEHNALKRENEDMRTKTYKDPIQAVNEAHQLAAQTGFIGAQAEEKEEEFDWKKGAFQAVKEVINKVPEIAGKIEEARGRNRGGPPPQMAGYQPQPQQLPPGAHPQQPQARPQQRQRGGYAQPPPGVAFIPTPQWQQRPNVPMAPGDAPPLPPQIFGPPRANPAPKPMYIGQTPQPKQAPVPIAGQQLVGEPSGDIGFIDANKVRQEQIPQPIPSEQQVQPVAQPPQETVNAGGIELSEEQVMGFVSRLDEVIASGIVPPQAFAQGLVEQIGKDSARAIIASADPEQLVNGLAQMPGSNKSAIVTREGRDYVQKLWGEVAKLV